MITAQYRCKHCFTTVECDLPIATLRDAGDEQCVWCSRWMELLVCDRCGDHSPLSGEDLCEGCIADDYIADPALLAADRQLYGGATWWPAIERAMAAKRAQIVAERHAERIDIVDSMTAAPL